MAAPPNPDRRPAASESSRRYAFPRRLRLSGRSAFDAIFKTGRRRSLGPLTVVALPNDLGYPRLGMTVSRRVGSAAKRNRIKRLLREAFRLMQHDLPRGYDLVVQVRPHDPLPLAEYQRMLAKAALGLHRSWTTPPRPTPDAPKPPDAPDTPTPPAP